jgi:hypothetical protein
MRAGRPTDATRRHFFSCTKATGSVQGRQSTNGTAALVAPDVSESQCAFGAAAKHRFPAGNRVDAPPPWPTAHQTIVPIIARGVPRDVHDDSAQRPPNATYLISR